MESELIGQLFVQGGVSGDWRNVRRWRTGAGERYTVEGWSGMTETCPLREGHPYSRCFVQCPKGGLHEWGIDGAHSNEYCKKCFVARPKL